MTATTWVYWGLLAEIRARGGVSVNEAKIEPKERDDDDDECAQIKLPPARSLKSSGRVVKSRLIVLYL